METGRFTTETLDSSVLKDNPLGDPTSRKLFVYLPKGYSSEKPVPALLGLAGYGGTGESMLNFDPFGEPLESRLNRLMESDQCPPAIVVLPDCFNRVGGSQYINSSAIGNYEDYLVEEVVPFVQEKYAVSSWGVFGKSSGGYGALVLGMRHPEVFQAIASHSGDTNFELCYLPDFPAALEGWRREGGPSKWLQTYWSDVNRGRRKYRKPLMALAMAAHYSPNPESPELGIDFPFDLETGVFRPKIWERWQKWDPVRLVDEYPGNLKKLKQIFIDCGQSDEFSLHWGTRALIEKMRSLGIEPHYEEFDDGHMSLSYRYDQSLPILVKALNP